MTRKDSEKEAERPHYYSQFWLDVAAGRKIIGASRPGEEESAEPEPQEVAPRRSARSASATVEHEEPAYSEVAAPTAREEEDDTEAYTEPEPEEDLLAGEEELDHDQELPNILVDEEPEVPDVDVLDEDEDEDFYEEEEEEEEEDEDLDWGRGRKKPKPGRQTKQPPKRTKRDRDRRY
jgi:hypothetical protein